MLSPCDLSLDWRNIDYDLLLQISGVLKNTGNNIMLSVDDKKTNAVNFSDGPLMYTYRLAEMKIHIGNTNSRGSEHTIDDKSFGAEVSQISLLKRFLLFWVKISSLDVLLN